MPACPAGGERSLTLGEVDLARGIFGDAIDYSCITIKRRKWFLLQPQTVVMAPVGHLHFHHLSENYCDDFSAADMSRQGLFIHEMTHVWQVQTRGRWFLILNRMPWARYDYVLRAGWPLVRYGIEQQAEIVRHAFLLRKGHRLAGIDDASAYEMLVNFPGATLRW